MVTAAWISSIFVGSAIRATPPATRMSAGTRSSAITAAAPAASATRACSAVTTSMITPPFSISARPDLTANVPSCFTQGRLLQLEGFDAVGVLGLVHGVDAIGERLDDAHQRGVRANVGRAVGGVEELVVGELRDLGERRVGHRDRR